MGFNAPRRLKSIQSGHFLNPFIEVATAQVVSHRVVYRRLAKPRVLMAIGGEKNDQPGRYQPDEEVKPRHHEIERGHTTLLSGEAGSLPGTVSYLRSLA